MLKEPVLMSTSIESRTSGRGATTKVKIRTNFPTSSFETIIIPPTLLPVFRMGSEQDTDECGLRMELYTYNSITIQERRQMSLGIKIQTQSSHLGSPKSPLLSPN